MILIIEGLDRCGKDTLIKNIKQKLLTNPNTFVIHCSSPPKNSDSTWSKTYYTNLLNECSILSNKGYNIILNRSHYGEDVYGPIYRNNSADWVYEISREILNPKDSVAIFLVDEPECLIEREDGESFYTSIEDIKRTKERFEHVYEKCELPKLIYNISLDGGWMNLDNDVIRFIRDTMK